MGRKGVSLVDVSHYQNRADPPLRPFSRQSLGGRFSEVRLEGVLGSSLCATICSIHYETGSASFSALPGGPMREENR